ncbi:MAG TPA: D-glycerate dehydrogenase [Rhodospirillaceae bacterium]|nr:D-glycerate dehydrogenase [Rhodospirillaceae bacterium]MBB58017.1 D-glycerate dehydrogenase [Rhodospirillaceae bacterium]HAE03670.1 D-glycerate dehydrogenase [Rhodospirillaceae bacterium]HBM14061.1 D-glycerate dehydrogenase [Rhodospirillaceae bacterium]|tara:strand:- start:13215 stop:14180 length:966 start_codon:yes stop_codon:yes gene_type:complete
MSDLPKVFATRLMPEDVEARFRSEFDALPNETDAPMDTDAIVTGAQGCRAIICSPTEKMDAETIAALPKSVEILATFSVGCDHIDLAAAKARGLIVTNTPDVLTDATADTTILCLLGAARMAQDAEATLRAGKWGRWAPRDMLGVHMSGKRLGIVGMGRIGQAVARRAKGFDMTVLYHNRRQLEGSDDQGATFYAKAEDMLPLCDFLALTCPLTEDTKHWLNAERIALLPDRAIVANTARGPVVVDDALIDALKSGKVFAAGLDVFTGEPKLDPRYLDLPNAFLLPHIGSATMETRNDMGFRCLDNLAAHFAGQPLPSRVI